MIPALFFLIAFSPNDRDNRWFRFLSLLRSPRRISIRFSRGVGAYQHPACLQLDLANDTYFGAKVAIAI